MSITGTLVEPAHSTVGVDAPLPYNRKAAETATEVLGKYSRGSLALAMGVGTSMVSRILSGNRMPSTETLAKLHRETKLPMESLYSYFLMRRAEWQTGGIQ